MIRASSVDREVEEEIDPDNGTDRCVGILTGTFLCVDVSKNSRSVDNES